MTAVWAMLAFFVPWASGCAVIRRWSEVGTPKSLVIGAGWLVGQVGVMALVSLSFVVSGAGHARTVLALSGGLCVMVLWSGRRGVGPDRVGSESGRGRREYEEARVAERRLGDGRAAEVGTARSTVGPVMIVLVAASLGLKLLAISGAHAFVPIRGDDAISIWLFKAKVIATLDELPFDPAHDYYLGGSTPTYPVFVSLLAAWGPLVVGAWDERLATAPWLGFYISLILLVSGGLKRWLGAAPAWTIAYLVGSMPLVVIHAYRPGYADLPLAAYLAATVLFLLRWRSTGTVRDLGFGLVFAAAAAGMKREGPALAAVAVVTLGLGSFAPLRTMSRRALGLVSGGAAAAIVLAGMVLDFSDLAANLGELGWRPEARPALVRHLLAWDSFHFAGWMAAAAVVALAVAGRNPSRFAVIGYSLGAAAVVAGVFLLTPQARFAVNDQTPSRLFLQILPGIMLGLSAAASGRRIAASTGAERPVERTGA